MIEMVLLAGWPWIAVVVGLGACLTTRERDKQIPIDSPLRAAPCGSPDKHQAEMS